MTPGPTHEDPLLVLLPGRADVGEELAAFLAHAAVRHFVLPPIWTLDAAGVDLPAAEPGVATITAENLSRVLAALTRICDGAALDRLVAHTWRSVDEMVRDFYLQRSTLQTFASIFKLTAKSAEVDPPPAFRADRIHDHGFEVQYRLGDAGGAPDSHLAPPEEGSVVYYPFDPANALARAEAGLDAGPEVVLEAFAYADGRTAHRAVFEQVGRERGWTVVDRHAQ